MQIANMVGAKPVAVTRSKAKCQQLLDAGASAVIATETENVTARLAHITGGNGVQAIFDPVTGPLLTHLIEAAATHATAIIYGALSTQPTQLPVLTLLEKRIGIRSYDMNEVAADDIRLRKAVEFIRAGVEKGALAPTIDSVFELADIANPYRYLESNAQFGKVVVTLPSAGTIAA